MVVTQLHTEVSAKICHEDKAADLYFSTVFDGGALHIALTYIPDAPEQLCANPSRELQSHHMFEHR